jgi:hypothetical protein
MPAAFRPLVKNTSGSFSRLGIIVIRISLMKRILKPLLIALFLSLYVTVFAQDDDTVRFNYGVPIHEDSVQSFPQIDLFPKTNHQLVNQTDLPAKVRKALQKGKQYHGWHKSPVYYDKNTKLFLVRIQRGNDVKVFGLDDSGRPVTYDEYSEQ